MKPVDINFKLIIKVKDGNNNIQYKDIYCNLNDLLESPFVINDWSEEEDYKILDIYACHSSYLKINKKVVWENDIIECNTNSLNKKTKKYDIPITKRLLVEYKNGGFYAGGVALNFYTRNCNCKIIGNKYQNSLIKWDDM